MAPEMKLKAPAVKFGRIAREHSSARNSISCVTARVWVWDAAEGYEKDKEPMNYKTGQGERKDG